MDNKKHYKINITSFNEINGNINDTLKTLSIETIETDNMLITI